MVGVIFSFNDQFPKGGSLDDLGHPIINGQHFHSANHYPPYYSLRYFNDRID